MHDFSVRVNRSRVELEFTWINASDYEDELRSVFDSLRLLILDLVEVNLAWKDLPETEKHNRLVAHLALGMATQGAIVVAAERSRQHRMVIAGEQSLAQNGFPEFDGFDYLDD